MKLLGEIVAKCFEPVGGLGSEFFGQHFGIMLLGQAEFQNKFTCFFSLFCFTQYCIDAMARSAKPLSASGSDSSLAHFTHWPRQRCTARHNEIWQGSKAGSSKVQDAMPIAQLRDCVDLWELEPQAWTLDKPQYAELSEHPTKAGACQTIKLADTKHIAQAVTHFKELQHC